MTAARFCGYLPVFSFRCVISESNKVTLWRRERQVIGRPEKDDSPAPNAGRLVRETEREQGANRSRK